MPLSLSLRMGDVFVSVSDDGRDCRIKQVISMQGGGFGSIAGSRQH